MDEKKIEEIKSELLRTGLTENPSPQTADVVKLLKHRITADTVLPKMEFLFRLFGVPCFPRGELVAVAGKAKSGKTFFLSTLMSLLKGRILWYDTEQSEQSTQDILINRITPLRKARLPDIEANTDAPCADGEDLFAFNVRCENGEERLRLFSTAVAYLKPDLVVLDGVRDLISDINDGVEAQRITEQLMTLAQRHHCCIICVLHQNKSDGDRNLRGWIGTELTNKVFEVYACEKLKGSSTFRVEQTHSRKYDIGRELYYQVDADTGLPIACDKPAEQPRDDKGRWAKPRQNPAPDEVWQQLNAQYIVRHDDGQTWEWNLRRLFADALAGRDYLPYNQLMAIALGLSHIADKNQYYAAYRQALQQGIISEEKHPTTGQQLVRLVQEADLPF